jgi:hypothetical protein
MSQRGKQEKGKQRRFEERREALLSGLREEEEEEIKGGNSQQGRGELMEDRMDERGTLWRMFHGRYVCVGHVADVRVGDPRISSEFMERDAPERERLRRCAQEKETAKTEMRWRVWVSEAVGGDDRAWRTTMADEGYRCRVGCRYWEPEEWKSTSAPPEEPPREEELSGKEKKRMRNKRAREQKKEREREVDRERERERERKENEEKEWMEKGRKREAAEENEDEWQEIRQKEGEMMRVAEKEREVEQEKEAERERKAELERVVEREREAKEREREVEVEEFPKKNSSSIERKENKNSCDNS